MEFFCTAGRGTENFVDKEISERFKGYIQTVDETDGKVYFKILESCVDLGNRIYSLTTVERVFVHVLSQKNSSLKGRRELLTYIHSELNNQCLWRKALKVFYKVTNSNTCENFLSSERTLQKSRKAEEYANKRLKIDETLNSRIALEEQSRSDCKETIPLKKQSETGDADYKDSDKMSATKITDLEREEISQKQTSTQNNSVNNCHRKEISSRSITFRVSCKFSGSVKHKLSPQLTVKQIGVLISKLMGWRTDLRSPKIEICIHINDEAMVVGIPISREPLSKRPYIKHHGLRSTICRIMAHLAHIQAGDRVMDPMCGKTTILLEAVQTCKTAHYFGMDKDEKQVQSAQQNLEFGQFQPFVQLVTGNALNMPFPDNSIDKIITDAPFGQTHTVKTDLFYFYRKLLAEVIRVLKPGGLMVLLTSTEIKNFLFYNIALAENVLLPENKPGVSRVNSETFEMPAQKKEFNTCDLLTHHLLSTKYRSDTYIKQNNCQSSDHLQEPVAVNSGLTLENETDNCGNSDLSSNSEYISKKNNISGDIYRSTNTDSRNENKCVESTYDLDCNKSKPPTESLNTDSLNLKSLLVLTQCNYVKLGTTDGYICVMQSNKGK